MPFKNLLIWTIDNDKKYKSYLKSGETFGKGKYSSSDNCYEKDKFHRSHIISKNLLRNFFKN